mmetsp:Transcript_17883/g.21389  ORF Transcript_17883/g.21389 Transcript_17883/m.21389 type:complete len:88 (-) Transcript_17883:341-604(-)|eukprot:CAMPEP_0198251812 /NCGR_PEP_ID=MMETSP1447-20131203/2523_1 /TAXON_ID=420782 /ORGANISM="Chaetoceros dichaeta, Strain CCMP1751" /LENGTH=87 /DNA_ID=CAMNT_0043936913 /DNA_START=162 /DNA_END=425 /DNA_ORIENTATION=-
MTLFHIDGHELGIFATVTGLYGVSSGCLGKGWVRGFIHRQPVAAFSVALGLFGMALPIIVPPIRRRLGMATNQYEAGLPDVVHPSFK